jgi:hypothetical protein
MSGCSIYDDTLRDLSDATSPPAGSGGSFDGFAGTGGGTRMDGSSGADRNADGIGTAGRGGNSGAAGTSASDGAAGNGATAGAAGSSGIDAAAGGGGNAGTGGTAGRGGAAGTSGASGAGGSSDSDGSTGADRSSGADHADTGQPCVVGPGPASLPFAVDQYFVSSGWMQAALIHQEASCFYPADAGSTVDAGRDASGTDSATAADGSTGRDGSSSDANTVPPLPGSKCWTIRYTPASATDWAGVNWQYPIDNWGASPGLVIPPGATRVSLVAWGDTGTERVTFQVGYGPASADGFVVSLSQQLLTPMPTRYAIDLGAIAYTCNSVRMGFGWLAEGGTAMTFRLADIKWE